MCPTNAIRIPAGMFRQRRTTSVRCGHVRSSGALLTWSTFAYRSFAQKSPVFTDIILRVCSASLKKFSQAKEPPSKKLAVLHLDGPEPWVDFDARKKEGQRGVVAMLVSQTMLPAGMARIEAPGIATNSPPGIGGRPRAPFWTSSKT